LIALGYKAGEVNKLIASLDVEGDTAEDIIRQALRQAAR
jgi:Holliday junction resolvasome RuvABC DNA-binding subunit